jgi:hypothetical protein
MPDCDEMLTMTPPPWRFISGATAWQQCSVLMKFTSIRRRVSSSGVTEAWLRSAGVSAPPALLTRI